MARRPVSYRRNREIKPIQQNTRRSNIFHKRRNALFKQTKELCDSDGAAAVVVVFSKAGNVFELAHPSSRELRDRCFPSTSGEVEGRDAIEKEKAADLPPAEIERRLDEFTAVRRHVSDELTKDLGVKELGELEEAVMKIRSKLAAAREKKMKERDAS